MLTGRSVVGLEETKSLISAQAPGVSIHVVPGDMGDMEALPHLCSQLLAPLGAAKHKKTILINNAGSIDDFETPFLVKDPKKLQDFFGINVTSMIVLTTRFLSASSSLDAPPLVVHITSLLAGFFVPGFPLYSTAKAARNAFMGVLKAESPGTRLLNYSPGPCDTQMYEGIPVELKKGFAEVVKPETTAQKLVKILEEDKYENGCIIDYYD